MLEVAMAAPTNGDRDVTLGHASVLRILKTCLFYPPLQVLTPQAPRVGRGREGRGSGGKGVRKAAGAAATPAAAAAAGGAKLVARALPPMPPPCPAARAAMDVPDADLQQLLDKLVLVRTAFVKGILLLRSMKKSGGLRIPNATPTPYPWLNRTKLDVLAKATAW